MPSITCRIESSDMPVKVTYSTEYDVVQPPHEPPYDMIVEPLPGSYANSGERFSGVHAPWDPFHE